MRVFHGFEAIPHFRNPAVTVGSYDGVHVGHQKLIARLLSEATSNEGESIVMTFDPHPRVALGKADGMLQLTTLDEKAALLKELGVENMIVIPFDTTFAHLTGQRFIEEYLIRKIGAKTLVAGYNHRFGHDRCNYENLQSMQLLKVIRVDACDVEGVRVSSTVIRRLIEAGDYVQAEKLLGHSLTPRIKQIMLW